MTVVDSDALEEGSDNEGLEKCVSTHTQCRTHVTKVVHAYEDTRTFSSASYIAN